MSRIQLLILAPSITCKCGGIENFCFHLVRSLDELELPLLAISLNPEEETRKHLIAVGRFPFFKKACFFVSALLVTILKRPKKVIILHCHFAPLGTWLARMVGAQSMSFLYGIEAWNVKNLSIKRALERSDARIAISSFTAEKVQEYIGKDCQIFPCTYSEQEYVLSSDESDASKFPTHSLKILTVARLSQSEGYKGVEKVLQLLPSLKERIESIQFVVIGAGDQLPALQQFAEQLLVSDMVDFKGYVPAHELQHYYQECSLFMLPSTGEGFGIVLLEAMASGLPTIGFRAGGIPDALRNGELGFLVDPDDQNALRELLTDLCSGKYQDDQRTNPTWLAQQVPMHFGHQAFKNRLKDIVVSSHE